MWGSARLWAQQHLGAFYEPVRDYVWRIFAISERTTPLWIGTYVLGAFLLYALKVRQPDQPLWRGFFRYLLPRDVYAHPSAKADYAFWVVDKLLFFVALDAFVVSGELVTQKLLLLSPVRAAAPSVLASAAVTVLTFLAFDFGEFLWHMLSHRVPAIWAFHRVHHAVEVLTPISNYREHPVDSLGRTLTQGLFVGLAQFVGLHLFPGARVVTLSGVNAVYFAFFIFANARHSHVWIDFGPRWGRIFSSPAQHQCHHGTAQRHIDINYGLMLSVWDHLFGTLYLPKGREDVQYGLVGEARPFPTLVSMYVQPFIDAWNRVLGKVPAKKLVPATESTPR